MLTVNETVRQINGNERNRLFGAVIGVVRENDDPEEMGCVRCEIPFLSPGVVYEGWIQPMFLNGRAIGFEPPELGSYVLILFLDGNMGDGIYIGQTMGKPQKELLRDLVGKDPEMHLALAEAVDRNFKEIRKYLQNHTHSVSVRGISGYPGTPITSEGNTRRPTESVPTLKTTKALRVPVSKDNQSKDNL